MLILHIGSNTNTTCAPNRLFSYFDEASGVRFVPPPPHPTTVPSFIPPSKEVFCTYIVFSVKISCEWSATYIWCIAIHCNALLRTYGWRHHLWSHPLKNLYTCTWWALKFCEARFKFVRCAIPTALHCIVLVQPYTVKISHPWRPFPARKNGAALKPEQHLGAGREADHETNTEATDSQPPWWI